MNKSSILEALSRFIRQRPGLEFANYGDVSAYRSELRSITRDKREAERLLLFVSLRDSITAEMLLEAAKSAFSGRLSIVERGDKVGIDYCTGQYWPTEYRKAAAAVMASAIWGWMRDYCMPAPVISETGERTYKGMSAGDYLRATCRREFGRSIATRWFQ